MTENEHSYPPVANLKGLERLDVRCQPDPWIAMHDFIQRRLAELEAAVKERLPDVTSTSGCTRGEGFLLFSYLVLTPARGHADPLTLGFLFKEETTGFSLEVTGDGESSGKTVLPAYRREAASMDELRALVSEEAARFLSSVDAIVAHLREANGCVG